MLRLRPIAVFLIVAISVCLFSLWRASSQSGGIRRVTVTSEEGLNINPTISGDGRRIAFESTENLAGASTGDFFRAIRADINVDPAAFIQMSASRGPAPGISQDGSRTAFAANQDPLGTNPDFNSEIFYFNGSTLQQVTNTKPFDISTRARDGNFLPSLTDDGRFIAFSSNRDLAGANSDGNFEIFIFDTNTSTFTQLTNTSGIVGSTDAKISGDGTRVAYIRDGSGAGSNVRDLLLQSRTGGAVTVLAAGPSNLAMSFGRAISDDGTRVVYQADSAADTSQVFLWDGRNNQTRQLTTLAAQTTLGTVPQDVPLDPTISGDGRRIAFATRRPITGFTNTDRSIEVYLYDTPTNQFARITNVADSKADGFAGQNRVMEVITSLNDDGSTLAFNYPRLLSGSVTDSDNENTSEIYVTSPAARPANGSLTVLNYASFGNEPASTKAIAPDSQAVALGTNLSNCTQQTPKDFATNSFPTKFCGTSVTVNGRTAQLLYVSPTQVVFLNPAETELGTATVIVTNQENYPSLATVPILKAAPGIFTKSGDGKGEAMVLDADTNASGPFDVRSGPRRVIVFTTGLRNATQVTATVGGRAVTVESYMASHDLVGLDEVRIILPSDLTSGNLNLITTADGRASNTTTIPIIGPTAASPTPTPAATPTPSPTPTPGGGGGGGTGAIVVSQVYGGGGNSGATLKNDFIELFNRGSVAVDFSGWSVQYNAAGNTTTWQVTPLCPTGPCVIQPGKYFLVQEAQGSGGTQDLPTPDATGTINMSGTTGKVALVNSTTALSGGCPSSASIIDLVGYGSTSSTANFCFEGAGPTPALTNTTAALRAGNGCVDTNNNNADFSTGSPNPRNSASPVNNCSSSSLSIDNITVTEGNSGTTPAIFTVTLSLASSQTVTVDYATADGTATAGSDYQSTNGTLTFAPGETSKQIAVNIIGDLTDEANETFFVNLTNATNAGISTAQGTGTITDDDAAPTLSISDVSVTEGNSLTTNATFTVTLSAASGQTVKVDYATADGTATAGTDYQSTSGTLTFASGETQKTITVLVNGDTTVEPNETFLVNLTNAINASILDAQGQGTITNDDAAPAVPQISINDVSVMEGNSGTTNATFTVSLNSSSTQTVTVNYATAAGTATAGTDYQTASGTLTINPGETNKTITVLVNGDILVEPDETFFVNLSNATNATIIDAQGQGTIQNDDTASLVISQVYGAGGNSGATYQNDFIEIFNRGTSTVDFSITPYSVQYAGATSAFGSNKTDITSGTLVPGQYFLIKEAAGTGCSGAACGAVLPTADVTGSISMAATAGKVALVSGITAVSPTACPGATTPTTTPAGNNIVDFVGYGTTANCYEGSGPAPAPSTTNADFRKLNGCQDTNNNSADFTAAAVAPRNSAAPLNVCGLPSLSINDVTVSESAGTATFTVSLNASSASTITVNYATADGTATAPADYASTSGTLTFAPGDLTKTITVNINEDTLDEADETFFVNLTSPSNATTSDNQGQGTITDNDAAPTLSINDVSDTEGNSGTKSFTFTVTLSAASGKTVTVDYATADGTATSPVEGAKDYQSTSGTLTFASGETQKTITVLVNGDTTVEPDETFVVNLTNAANASISDNQGTGTIQNDDTEADLSLTKTDSPDPVNAGDNITYSLTVTNNSSTTAAQDVTVSDAVPTNTTLVSVATPAGWNRTDSTAVGGTGTITFSKTTSLAASGNATFTIVVKVDSGTANGTTITNTATVASSTQDPNSANNSATAKTTVQRPADLSLTKTVDNATPNVNTNVTFTITVSNAGPFAATGVAVKDLLPSGLTYVSSTPSQGTYDNTTGVWTVGTINASSSATLTIVATATSSATSGVTNTAQVSASDNPDPDSTPNNNNAAEDDQASATVTPQAADLSLTKSVDNPTPNVGSNVIFTITVSNAGPNNATSVTVQDALPSGLTYVSDDGSGAYNSGTGVWTVGTVNASGSATLHITATVATSGAKTNTAEVTASSLPDPDSTPNNHNATEDDQASATVTPMTADLSLIKVVNNAAPNVGDRVDFSIQLTNDGPNTATGVQVTDLLPAGLSFLSATTNQGTYNSGTGLWNIGSVANGATPTLVITATVTTSGAKTNTAEVTASGVFDPDSTPNNHNATEDDQASATVTPLVADLSVSKTDSPDPVAIGNDITYTITVTNNGPNASVNATLSDTVPTNTTFQSLTVPSGWSCTTPAVNATGSVSCTNSSVATGSSVFTLKVRVNTSVTDGSTISNTAAVSSSTTYDSNSTNNSATQQTTVNKPNLVISQVYGAGGNSGATYQNDFVEIFNRGTTTVNFAATNYSIQYTSATGNFGGTTSSVKFDITSGTIAPGQYFLVKLAAGTGCSGSPCGSALPTADATGSIIMAAGAGKVALVLGTTALSTTTCPTDTSIVDFVGYGTTANCFEGTGPAPAPGTTTADIRGGTAGTGCLDNNNNATDFTAATVNPHNTASATHSCP